jgi:hypothetical protein
MGNKGYISLYRQILDNPIWNIKPYSKGQAWVTILLLTNHKVGYMPIKNGQLLKIERGECGYSDTALADIFGWSRAKVKRFLMLLEMQKMVQLKNRSNRNIINIINYETYQNGTVNVAVNDTVNEHLTLQQTNTNNNDNNDNNENNNIYINKEKNKNFIIPSLEEIKNYCIERKNNINAEHFFDYYSSKGWMIGKNKMKDWKAAVRTWERNKFSTNPITEKQTVDEEYNFGIG